MTAQRASVIIPCYNQGRFLAEAINSVLAQGAAAGEIIVVNDGSTDETSPVAASYGAQIQLIEQANRGLSGARNAGIHAAACPYIALLDADDAYLPGALERLTTYLDEHPDVALVCSDAFLWDGAERFGLKSTWSGKPRNPENFRWETVEYCATPSTVVMRRAVFDHVELFDETLKNAAEDWLMWVSMSRLYNLAYIDEPLVLYRVHDRNATRNVERINAGNRYAVRQVVSSPHFAAYPAHFRARLLYYRFACAFHEEPKHAVIAYFLRAVATDPGQIGYGVGVLRRGLSNTLRRQRKSG
ncbi:MAG: glycosyltransferase [Caldilineaceae bacterium]|nr:glycosyltransferase [Caldilineaceae bacterium]